MLGPVPSIQARINTTGVSDEAKSKPFQTAYAARAEPWLDPRHKAEDDVRREGRL